jgi:hypothetical protein
MNGTGDERQTKGDEMKNENGNGKFDSRTAE